MLARDLFAGCLCLIYLGTSLGQSSSAFTDNSESSTSPEPTFSETTNFETTTVPVTEPPSTFYDPWFTRFTPPTTTSVPPRPVHYAIVAPKRFRPGSNYSVTATCFNVSEDVSLTLTLQRYDNSVLGRANTVLKSDIPQILYIVVPEFVASANYLLVATGTGGVTFSDSRDVSVNSKTMSLFVQTDKATYKPGQTVRFRTLAVDQELKPYTGPLDIEVYDFAGNKIMQRLRQSSETGVITQSLPLSEQTPLGEWTIAVNAGVTSCTKTFLVAEYVLQTFEVSVVLPPYFLVNVNNRERQDDLLITTFATYTYGQPVRGRVNITIQLQSYGEWDTATYPQKQMDLELVDGKADARLTMDDITVIAPQYNYRWYFYTPDPWNQLGYRTIQVFASVTENVTGLVLSGNDTVDCKTQKYDLVFLDISPNNYKPGLVYRGFLRLSQPNGAAPDLADIRNADGSYRVIDIQVTKNYPYDYYNWYWYPVYQSPVTENIQAALDSNGLAKISLKIGSEFSSVDFQASFFVNLTNSYSYNYKNIKAFKSRDNQGLQVSFVNEDGVIKAEEDATFNVKSTNAISTFQYEIISKGNILLSDSVSENSSKEHSFSIRITKKLVMKLAPVVYAFVWISTENGELIADSTEISVSYAFMNEVTLSFDTNMTTPSQNVSLTVNAYPNSTVYFLAVDQSVLLLKGGNDITQNMVLQDQKSYDDVKTGNQFIWWPVFIDGVDTASIADNTGLIIMTDGYVKKEEPRYYPMFFGRMGIAEGATFAATMNMPDATTQAPPPDPSKDLSQTRVNFLETFLWGEAVTGNDGTASTYMSVPDTISSFIASAFAVSKVAGLGIASNTAKITVFKNFFISMKLPFSIIRGEEFALQVTVFNYMSDEQKVKVALKSSDNYRIIGKRSKMIKVNSKDAMPVYFWINATKLNQIPIKVSATSHLAGDSVEQMLLVKAEGVCQQYSSSSFIQLSSSNATYTTTFNVSLPPSGVLVQGSEHVEMTFVGNVIGSSINGLENLLQMPYGCGEQNMLNFAPDVYIVEYLNISNLLTPDFEAKAYAFINAGYQRQLTYQRSDGSFSAFGNSDQSGSIWLSALVILCFHQAKNYIPVDDYNIARTMQWIMHNQAPNGSFAEPPYGRVIHVDMQGQSSQGLPLTAYVLNALLENRDNLHVNSLSVSQVIFLASSYLEDHMNDVASDPYSLSIMAYVLARAKSPRLAEVLNLLEALAIVEGGMKHWEKKSDSTDSANSDWYPPYQQASAVNIEISSYALLTFYYLNDFLNSLPIAKWIMAQRNTNGGFSSTQDTILALESLTKFGKMISGRSDKDSLQISIATETINHTFLPISRETALLMQSYELPSNTKTVKVMASGLGSAVAQLNVRYNMYETKDNSGIDLNIQTSQKNNSITLTACCSWTLKEGSGMVVMEITLLTGFQASNIDELKSQPDIRRVEDSDGKIVVYFDGLTRNETCVVIILDKVHLVGNVKDGLIKVYPYYDPKAVRTGFYKAPEDRGQNDPCIECPDCCE